MQHHLRTVAHFESDLATVETQPKSRYEIYEDRVEVYDFVWGEGIFEGDSERNKTIFTELANTDALRRLQTIEQLTLPDRYKTIPESTHFSRWEHAWGSALFAKQLAEQMGCDEATSVKMQLRALLSDVCHTAHSHAGDWLFQGKGKKETFHDERRLNYAEVVGINEVLRKNGFDPAEILAEEADGIIDAKMPWLDVDRVDYTLREAYRWVNQIPEFREKLNKDSFTVHDGKIVVKNKEAAMLLGISYVLLVTEHWQDPVHRLQLELFMESIKRVLVARDGESTDAGTYRPIDLMMVTDDTLANFAGEHDDYMPMLDELMQGVSISETQNRWHARADRIRTALSSGLQDGSNMIQWIKDRYDTLPRSYEIRPAYGSGLRNSKYLQVIALDRLGKRLIIPPYLDEDGEVRLLSEDESFTAYMEQAINRVQQNWRAAIIGNEVSTFALRECLKLNKDNWERVKNRQPMPNSVLRRQLRRTVETSNGAASKFVDVKTI